MIVKSGALLVLGKPESHEDIERVAQRLLRKSGSLGVLPTPIDQLIKTEKILDLSDADSFRELMQSAKEQGHAAAISLMQKIRGIADRRRKVIFVDSNQPVPRQLFVRAHELGHHALEWQQLNSFFDDQVSLSSQAQALFEREANYFASAVIFQGQRFMQRARDVRPSFDAVFELARDHGASRHATAHQFIEVQDEAVALVTYWPRGLDQNGDRILRSGQVVGSNKFRKKYGEIDIPLDLRVPHPWTAALALGQVIRDEMLLSVDGLPTKFEWHAWWNTHTLLVLLRRKPLFSGLRLAAA